MVIGERKIKSKNILSSQWIYYMIQLIKIERFVIFISKHMFRSHENIATEKKYFFILCFFIRINWNFMWKKQRELINHSK